MISQALLYGPGNPSGVDFNAPIDLLGSYATPSAGRVFVVRGDGTSVLNYDDQYTQMMPGSRMIYKSVAEASALTVAGRGDTIMVLPNTTENISVADQWALKAGVKVIGIGDASNRPTFTWTAAASSILLANAGIKLVNLNLFLCPAAGGGVTVTAPITVSAAGCSITGGSMRVSTDATTLCTIGLTTTAAATDLTIAIPRVYGATAGTPTTCMQFVGATRLNLFNMSIAAATSATGVGVIRFLTTASTDIEVYDCVFRNNLANSTAAVTGMAGVTGEADYVTMKVLSGGVAAWGTVAGMCFGPSVVACNTDGQRAVVFGTGSTLA